MRVMLDTSAYSSFKRNHAATTDLIRRCQEIVFSPTVAGELLSGFRWGTRFPENLRELQEFLDHPRVQLQPITLSTADRYGRVYASLRRRGTPIPSNDMWVAAQAMETGAELASFDTHFEQVEGLAWINLG